MGRRPGTAKICVICSDKAKGINFGAPSCMSCKAFFRRNALSEKELTCPFTDNCSIDIITRRFCTKCRLKKCFNAGMKKEWILSDDEREKIKEKIRLNKIKRQEDMAKQMKGQEWATSLTENEHSPQSYKSQSSLPTPPDSTTSECSNFSSSPVTSVSANTDILASLMPTIFTPAHAQNKDSFEDLQSSNGKVNQIDLSESSEEQQLFDEITDEILMQTDNANNNSSSFDLDYLDLDNLNSPSGSTTSNSNCQTLSLFESKSSKYDSILEFIPSSPSTGQVVSELPNLSSSFYFYNQNRLYPDITAFPYQEMVLPESCLLQELTVACSVLQNPYKRIQYLESFDMEDASRISQYMFHRLIRASKGLSAFNSLSRDDQGLMMKLSLLKMLSIRTVVMYNQSRECWGFINDNAQANVLVSMRYIEPYCTKCGYQRHKNLPNLFREEWKSDNHIFDLLTAIVLFTPRPEYSDNVRIESEHNRYRHLLYRYLTLKYPTITEAEESFHKLLANVEEMFTLNDDIVNFMKSFGVSLAKSDFYKQLLDLSFGQPNSQSSSSIEVLEEPAISEIPVEQENTDDSYLEDLLWL